MIKQLNKTDFAKAANVIRASFLTVAKGFGWTGQNCPKYTAFATTEERLQEHLSWGWDLFGLYNDKQKLIGYVSLSKADDNSFELHNLAVLPEYRHNGYGKKLIDFCKEKVKEMQGNKIKLSYIEENTVIKSWYIQNGFVNINTKKFDHLPFTSGYMEYIL